jgi:hypothetical protein
LNAALRREQLLRVLMHRCAGIANGLTRPAYTGLTDRKVTAVFQICSFMDRNETNNASKAMMAHRARLNRTFRVLLASAFRGCIGLTT